MAQNNDKRNRFVATLITLLLGAGILALLIFTGIHYEYPPRDARQDLLLQDTILFGGNLVMLGDMPEAMSDDTAAPDVDDAQDSEATEVNETQQEVGQNQLKDNGRVDEAPQQPVATKAPSPMTVKEQPPKKQPAEKKTDPQPQQPTKPQKKGDATAQPATKKVEQPKPAAASAKSSEADNRMRKAFGNGGSGSGKQGTPGGSEGGNMAVGRPGVGGLDGYTLEYFPTDKVPAAGTVVIRVTVSPTGSVSNAVITGGSVTDAKTRSICLSLAKRSRFSVPKNQNIERTGTLTYTIH